MARHSRLLYHEATISQHACGEDEVAIRYELSGREGPNALHEAALASLAMNARRLTSAAFRPVRLHLHHRSSAVASKLGLHARTLQRRLREQGVTLKSMTDQLREELARAYLANPKLPLAEVPFLLGYSDPAAFHRAFRRWTGASPGAYRATVASR